MSQKRYRPAGARVSKPTTITERTSDPRRRVSDAATREPGRDRQTRHRHQPGRARRAVLAVELAIQMPDGRRPKRTQVRIAGTAIQSRATPDAAFPGVRGREIMAQQVIRGVDPAGLARLLAAIAHPQRLTILFKLMASEATHQSLSRATGLKAGPLYYHLRELRAAGLIGPKVRDSYVLTPAGTRLVLTAIAAGRLCGEGK